MIQAKRAATVADLYRVQEKAELINGEIVITSPASFGHGRTAGAIYMSLVAHEEKSGRGVAVPDNVGFLCDLPHRQSFSPDAAYYFGPCKQDEFVDGAPALAVEVRSPEDFGPVKESELAAKRADYFAAGTQVVWDVDAIRDRVIRVYRATAPDEPAVYRAGEVAEAEPALPGWRLPVQEVIR
jgi:Uma2 family endonuclease